MLPGLHPHSLGGLDIDTSLPSSDMDLSMSFARQTKSRRLNRKLGCDAPCL